jgi:hypothetical protein
VENEREAALDAATGLTTIEAENAYALCVAQAKNIVPAIISREKAQAVKKNGLLEIVETKESLDSIGGLDVLKDWLLKRRNAFGKKARAYGHCLSIAIRKAAACPVCGAQWFYQSEQVVTAVVWLAAKTLFPSTAATAPRLPVDCDKE